MLATRGILDKVKNKVNQVEKTAEEYKNKAKGTNANLKYFAVKNVEAS